MYLLYTSSKQHTPLTHTPTLLPPPLLLTLPHTFHPHASFFTLPLYHTITLSHHHSITFQHSTDTHASRPTSPPRSHRPSVARTSRHRVLSSACVLARLLACFHLCSFALPLTNCIPRCSHCALLVPRGHKMRLHVASHLFGRELLVVLRCVATCVVCYSRCEVRSLQTVSGRPALPCRSTRTSFGISDPNSGGSLQGPSDFRLSGFVFRLSSFIFRLSSLIFHL